MTGDQQGPYIQHGEFARCSVLRLAGSLDHTGYVQLRDTIVQCSAEQPFAVIVVVDQLGAATAGLLSGFARDSTRLSAWPGVPVLLVVLDEPNGQPHEHALVPGFGRYHRTIDEAVRTARSQSRRQQAKVALPRLATPARRAREFTRQVCERWLLGATLVADAVMVANELVENVLLHTSSQPSLRLELRTKQLSVAVGDLSSVPARLREGTGGRPGGLGLLLVAQLAKAWGSTPTMSGGKVVWAVMDTEPSVSSFAEFSPHADRWAVGIPL